MLEYTVGRIGSSSSLNLFAEPPKFLLSFYHYCYDNHRHSLPKPRSSFTPQPQPHLSSHFHCPFPSNCKWALLTFLNIHFLSTNLHFAFSFSINRSRRLFFLWCCSRIGLPLVAHLGQRGMLINPRWTHHLIPLLFFHILLLLPHQRSAHHLLLVFVLQPSGHT